MWPRSVGLKPNLVKPDAVAACAKDAASFVLRTQWTACVLSHLCLGYSRRVYVSCAQACFAALLTSRTMLQRSLLPWDRWPWHCHPMALAWPSIRLSVLEFEVLRTQTSNDNGENIHIDPSSLRHVAYERTLPVAGRADKPTATLQLSACAKQKRLLNGKQVAFQSSRLSHSVTVRPHNSRIALTDAAVGARIAPRSASVWLGTLIALRCAWPA